MKKDTLEELYDNTLPKISETIHSSLCRCRSSDDGLLEPYDYTPYYYFLMVFLLLLLLISQNELSRLLASWSESASSSSSTQPWEEVQQIVGNEQRSKLVTVLSRGRLMARLKCRRQYISATNKAAVSAWSTKNACFWPKGFVILCEWRIIRPFMDKLIVNRLPINKPSYIYTNRQRGQLNCFKTSKGWIWACWS